MHYREILTNYDAEIIQTEALLDVARACRDYEYSSMSAVAESYSDLNEYSTTTEGAIGDFFKRIVDAIKNFFKKIIDFFKNLFGGKSSDKPSNDSKVDDSPKDDIPLEDIAKEIEKNKEIAKDIEKDIDEQQYKLLQFVTDSANFEPKTNETLDEYDRRMNDLLASKGLEPNTPEYNTAIRFIEINKSQLKARDDAKRAKERDDENAKREAERKAKEAERKAKLEAQKAEDEARRKLANKKEEHDKNIRSLNSELDLVIRSIKGDYFHLNIDDSNRARACTKHVYTIVDMLERIIDKATMVKYMINDDIVQTKKTIDNFVNMDPNGSRRDIITKQALNRSGYNESQFTTNYIPDDILNAIGAALNIAEVKSSKHVTESEVKSYLHNSLYTSRDEIYVLISEIDREKDAFEKIDDLASACNKLIADMNKAESDLFRTVQNAQKAIENMSKKYENDPEMTKSINEIKAKLTAAVNGTIRSYSCFASVCAMLKTAANNRMSVIRSVERSIRIAGSIVAKRARFGNSKKYTGKKKLSESYTLESAYSVLNEYF